MKVKKAREVLIEIKEDASERGVKARIIDEIDGCIDGIGKFGDLSKEKQAEIEDVLRYIDKKCDEDKVEEENSEEVRVARQRIGAYIEEYRGQCRGRKGEHEKGLFSYVDEFERNMADICNVDTVKDGDISSEYYKKVIGVTVDNLDMVIEADKRKYVGDLCDEADMMLEKSKAVVVAASGKVHMDNQRIYQEWESFSEMTKQEVVSMAMPQGITKSVMEEFTEMTVEKVGLIVKKGARRFWILFLLPLLICTLAFGIEYVVSSQGEVNEKEIEVLEEDEVAAETGIEILDEGMKKWDRTNDNIEKVIDVLDAEATVIQIVKKFGIYIAVIVVMLYVGWFFVCKKIKRGLIRKKTSEYFSKVGAPLGAGEKIKDRIEGVYLKIEGDAIRAYEDMMRKVLPKELFEEKEWAGYLEMWKAFFEE